jgi:hypothetical protein
MSGLPPGGGRTVQADHVGFLQHFIKRRVAKIRRRRERLVRHHIVGEHFHLEAQRELRHEPPDVPAADEAQRLANQFKALAPLPTPRLDAPVTEGNPARQREDVGQRQFGHAARVGAGGLADRDAQTPGGSEINVVHADAVAADDAKAWRGFKHVGADGFHAGQVADAAGQQPTQFTLVGLPAGRAKYQLVASVLQPSQSRVNFASQ